MCSAPSVHSKVTSSERSRIYMYAVYGQYAETTCIRMKHILQKHSHTTAQFKEGMGDITKEKHAVLIAQK